MNRTERHHRRWLAPTLDLREAKTAKEIVQALATSRAITLGGETTDDWKFPDSEKAILRLQKALSANEKIAIFGDYDCDGVTGTALLVRALKRRNARPVVRLPHRGKEGYGLKEMHVEECAKAGVTLLFTVDTGISCKKEVALAKARGMDVIILDHHHVPVEHAEPFAVLHPSLTNVWKGSAPSAAGVVWAFVRDLETYENTGWPGAAEDLVLGALGTIADLVELKDGNRALVRDGIIALKKISQGPLAELALQSNVGDAATARDWAFRLAPRINAAGRMEDPMIALRALLGDKNSMMELERLNSERQENVRGHESELDLETLSGHCFLCATSDAYTPGIVGLLAGKLTERFGKPSLVGSVQNGVVTASLRSIPGYNVTEALGRHAHLLISFGGHAMAAGCTFLAANFEQLKEGLGKDVLTVIPEEDLKPMLPIDAMLNAFQLTKELAEELTKLEPHGQGNLAPRFCIEGVNLRDAGIMGSDGSHLRAKLGNIRIVGFGFGSLADDIMEHPVDVAGHLSVQVWRGETRVEMFLDDIKVKVKVG